MEGNIKSDSLKYTCKYSVDQLILMLGEEKLVLDHSNVLSIEYVNDYEFNIRSLLKVSLQIDVRRKMWLLRNKRDITCKFELSRIGMDMESENFVTNPELVWNGEFKVYFNDEEESTDVAATEARIAKNENSSFAINDIESENYFETQNTLDIYLFNQDLLNASQRVYNQVFTENTLQTCVGRLLTMTKHKKVLMSRFENDEIYSELIVPALPAYKSLIYLDQYYGFYKDGALIYYDLDKLYILNSNGRMTARQEDEIVDVSFFVATLDNSTPGNGMLRMEGEHKYYCSITEANINPQRPSIGNNTTYGSEAKIVVSDDVSINIAEANQSYIDQRNENISFIGKNDNKFTSNIVKARMEENECIMYINAESLDINAFGPNKQYNIIYDDTSKHERYGKDVYRLSYAYHYLTARSGNYMDSKHFIVLKKRPTDEEVITEEGSEEGEE